MSKINVIGGVYAENCSVPMDSRIRGSGGRGARFLGEAGLCPDFYTCWPKGVSLEKVGLGPHVAVKKLEDRDFRLSSFTYAHQLANPVIDSDYVYGQRMPNYQLGGPEFVSSECILKYGMLEGDVKTKAEKVVFDPQSPTKRIYSQNESSAGSLALVLNEGQCLMYGEGGDINVSAKAAIALNSADIAVVKRGPWGARVYQRNGDKCDIPVYVTKRVWKIGSGDIFSAAFFKAWAIDQMTADKAADYASRSVARYVEEAYDDTLPTFYDGEGCADKGKVYKSTWKKSRQVYIGGPFFDVGQRMLVEEVVRIFGNFGISVFSPIHEVGFSGSKREIAALDIEGLRKCSAMLALLDGGDIGTLVEVGHALEMGKRVVVLAHSIKEHERTMLDGLGCIICSDLCSAVHEIAWGK